MIGNSAIKELRNKFNLLKEQDKGDLEVLAIFEKELGNSFPSTLPGYISHFGWIKTNSVKESWFL